MRGRRKETELHVDIKVIDTFPNGPTRYPYPSVKNYSLDGVAHLIKDKLGDGPVIVA
jgi:hypothetical protein